MQGMKQGLFLIVAAALACSQFAQAAATQCDSQVLECGVEHPSFSAALPDSEDKFLTADETSEDKFFTTSESFVAAAIGLHAQLEVIDFGSAIGQSAPIYINGAQQVALYGSSAKIETECGAAGWGKACLWFQNSLQIQFAMPIRALSFLPTYMEDAVRQKLTISLFDADGTLIESSSTDSDFFGTISTHPFQSMLISVEGSTSIAQLEVDEVDPARTSF